MNSRYGVERTVRRYRRKSNTSFILFALLFMSTCVGCGFLSAYVYQLPSVNERLFWRVEVAKSRVREVINPREADILPTVQPTERALTFAGATAVPTIQIAFEDVAPDETATPTPELPTNTPAPTATPLPPDFTATATLIAFPTPTQTPPPITEPTAIPNGASLTGISHEYQRWNNCGPATLAMMLSYWGWDGTQQQTASFLKPDQNDKNVRPDEMQAFLDEQVSWMGHAYRVGGNLELLKALVASGYPVIAEKGYDVDAEIGWMGHYVLVTGYDDNAQKMITFDSYRGPNERVSYEKFDYDWQAFNRLFVVLFPIEDEAKVMAMLGDHATLAGSYDVALRTAQQETLDDSQNVFAWHNLGTNYNYIRDYEAAAGAFDMARNVGMPWRMLWYQFGVYRAYYETGRQQEVYDLSQITLTDAGGGLEESYFWRGSAQLALGDIDAAIADYERALEHNPNFREAESALTQLGIVQDG